MWSFKVSCWCVWVIVTKKYYSLCSQCEIRNIHYLLWSDTFGNICLWLTNIFLKKQCSNCTVYGRTPSLCQLASPASESVHCGLERGVCVWPVCWSGFQSYCYFLCPSPSLCWLSSSGSAFFTSFRVCQIISAESKL